MDYVSQMRWLLSTRPLPLPLSSMPYDLSSGWNSVNLPRSTNELEIPDEIMEEGILLYFQHFHNQPYPLLTGMNHNPRSFVAEYPKLVLFPLLAVSLRTCQNPFFHSREALSQMCGMLSEAAWNLLAARYSKFDFDLAYFQALCLLAQVDFASKCHNRYHCRVLKLVQSWQTAPGSGSGCSWLKARSNTWLASQRMCRSVGGSHVTWLAFGRVDTVHDGSHFQRCKREILLRPGFIFSALPNAMRSTKSRRLFCI